MSERFRFRAVGGRQARRRALIAVLMLGLAGCGSTAATKPAGHPSAAAGHPSSTAGQPSSAGQPLASAPARGSGSRRRSPASTSTTASRPGPAAPASCPAGEKRTASGLCYSPAAQAKLVAKLGPCLAGQVVADNGACQPLSLRAPTHQPSLPARCRRPHRSSCVLRGAVLAGKVPRSPGLGSIGH